MAIEMRHEFNSRAGTEDGPLKVVSSKVPVVAYHSIADRHDHLVNQLSLPVRVFERQLRFLKRRGYQTVSLYDVHAHLKEGVPLPAKAIALTFDDGYLDNWVYAYPLLKKYGMQATVFVATDFVESRNSPRPTLEDVWAGRLSNEDLEWWGHASWVELEEMQADGTVDIQSHTRTHTWYYSSDRIVDFHHPDDEYMWLHWNAHPAAKPYWLNADFRAGVPWGTPVYDFSQTLLKPRYMEDPALTHYLTDHVTKRGGPGFFSRPGWKQELHRVAADHRARFDDQGRYESAQEYEDRVVDELVGSKRILESRLGTTVDFICWPCGDYTRSLQEIAVERCGYLASVNCAKTTNQRGDDPRELRRVVFGQQYQGPFSSQLVFLNFTGTVCYHSGVSLAFPVAPISWRLMKLGELLRHSRQAFGRRWAGKATGVS